MDWNDITGEKKRFSCKLISNKEEVSLLGKDWAYAKRCFLEFGNNKLIFPENDIYFNEIKLATMRIYRSAFFIQGCVLTIKGDSFIHHFGLKYSDFWKAELPFKVERVNERPPFLLLRQSLIIILIIYVLYQLAQKM